MKVAKKALGGHPFLLVNSDVLFAPSILAKMLNVDRHIVVAVDSGRTLMDEEMKVSVGPDGHVVAIGKWLDPSASHAEFMGVAKFSSEGAVRFFEAVEETIRDQGVQVFYERALNRLAQRGFPIYCADFKGYPWIEIDDYDDLNLARTVVINQILDSPG